jgi:hypothetical protein
VLVTYLYNLLNNEYVQKQQQQPRVRLEDKWRSAVNENNDETQHSHASTSSYNNWVPQRDIPSGVVQRSRQQVLQQQQEQQQVRVCVCGFVNDILLCFMSTSHFCEFIFLQMFSRHTTYEVHHRRTVIK